MFECFNLLLLVVFYVQILEDIFDALRLRYEAVEGAFIVGCAIDARHLNIVLARVTRIIAELAWCRRTTSSGRWRLRNWLAISQHIGHY